MIKLIKRFNEYQALKKRKSQIMQTATDFWNECEQKIKEQEGYGETV